MNDIEEENISAEEELEEDIELDDIDLSEITFENKSLDDWVTELTVMIPSLPANSVEITQCMISISNKYQIAYNCYSKLLVLCSAAEKQYKAVLDEFINNKINELKTSGIKKMPSKDSLEIMVVVNSKRLKAMTERVNMFLIVKHFFECNKNKLEKTMSVAKELIYSITSNDRIHKLGSQGHGL